MRHNIFGKQLNRDTGQRQALLKGLAGALVRSEAIETTEAKAKAARGLIEKLITQARNPSVSDLRQIEEIIIDKDLLYKLVHNIAPRFQGRPGGYLRLIPLGHRAGDNAPMVRMELIPGSSVTPETKNTSTQKNKEKTPVRTAKKTTPSKAPVKKKVAKP